MQELWSSASYEPHLLSLPFALAPAGMLSVIAYAAVMRGAPALRGWLLAHMLALLPYAIVVMLSPSIRSPAVAEQLFRAASSAIPMTAACGTGFQLALIRRDGRYRALMWFLVGNAAIWLVLGNTTDLVVGGIAWLGSFWFPIAGPYSWVGVIHTLAIAGVGCVLLGHVALTSRPSDERRQLRAALLANLVTYTGLIDVALSYGIGVFPFGWFLSAVGCVLVVRALVVEDLLRVRAVDSKPPLLVVHFACAALLAWVALRELGPAPWWLAAPLLGAVLVGVRAAIAAIGLVTRGARGREGPLARLLAQLVQRARELIDAGAIARLLADVVHLGVGVQPTVLLAAEEDWGWTDASGARLADAAAPDPLLLQWLAERRAPLFADELEQAPDDLRELTRALLERHGARALVPVPSADELLGLVLLPAGGRRIRGRELAFVERAAERLAEALLHARMARRAAARAAIMREVELAATVQAELLPGTGPHVHGALTVLGSWQPATRCAGDFWSVAPLGDGRVLVAIGDVTGHGVASAMVTAAAVGACDVSARRGGPRLELTELCAALEAAVRRVGGGQLAMTCFAAILDPARRELSYVSCGHTAPYLCRAGAAPDARVELHALVARGNPLGSGATTPPRVAQRSLEPGDLLLWYTDGVIEAQDPAGRPFGDRRLQHLLKRLDRQRLSPAGVHELVLASVAAHRAGRPLADDETVVVAQLAASAPAAGEVAA